MNDPHDDTDVPSGTTDGAQMESTSPPLLRLHLCSCLTRLERPKPASLAILSAAEIFLPLLMPGGPGQ
jgi:hypothetical protein